MAANRFATMLHRNTHKLVLLLVYAVLEWALILLLLLNSLFSYFITKFATYFGLQKPCLLCSRVDHIFESRNQTKCYTDLLCESHAAEISQLRYCSNHQKLVEARNICGSCFASSSGMETKIPAFIDIDSGKLGSDENVLRCSCCSEKFNQEYNPNDPCFLFKPSWGSLEYTQKRDLVMEAVDGDENNNKGEFVGQGQQDQHDEADVADEHDQFPSNVDSFNSRDTLEEDCLSSSSMFICYEKEAMEDGKASLLHIMRQGSNGSSEFVQQCSNVSVVQFHTEEDDLTFDIQYHSKNNNNRIRDLNHRLIPVKLIDFSTRPDKGGCSFQEEDLRENDTRLDENLCCRSRIASQLKCSGEATLLGINKTAERSDNLDPENLKIAIAFVDQSEIEDTEERKQDLVDNSSERVLTAQEIQSLQINVKEAIMTKLNDLPEVGSERRFLSDQITPRTLVTAQVSDCATGKDLPSLNNNCPEHVYKIPEAFIGLNDLGQNRTEKATKQGKGEYRERIENSCKLSEPNKQKEHKFLNAPTSIDGHLHYTDKKWLASEKRESGAKESFDGSVASEMEGGDVVASIEELKTALKSERKALSVLYAELEEERSASAVAANQTMAMITRLQEEKAAMQMEALQYQRMMEEQSEYDQEALQLLNDLMIKREREKKELEGELEAYRKKVLEYEEKEKMRMIRRIRDGSVRSRNSSASCGHAWDSDDLSIDLNRELRDEDSSYSHQESNINNNNTQVDMVLNLEEITLDCVKHIGILDESLTEFEEERLSILDQLKTLEDKLIKLGNGDDEFSKDLKLVANTSQSNAEEFEGNLTSTPEENGISDGFLKDDDDPEMKILIGSMAKKLLPLLDASAKESTEGFFNEEKVESTPADMQNNPVSKFELGSDKVAIEEEVDHVYERLQALEADREFLKNCMSSIKKGDKGVDLLQEILQHLRDLRAIELRMRNTNEESPSEVSVN